jgi:hypothetical protein
MLLLDIERNVFKYVSAICRVYNFTASKTLKLDPRTSVFIKSESRSFTWRDKRLII